MKEKKSGKPVKLKNKGEVEYRMANEPYIIEHFGTVTLTEDLSGELTLKFKKMKFSVWINPKDQIFTVINNVK